VLPLGISFYTFQGMSYLFDVYMGKHKAQKNPFLVFLYIILFPQLVAGPIVNYSDVANELSEREHTIEGFSEGASRFMLGLGKKMVLSGAMGEIADEVFAIPPAELPASAAWVGAFAYLFQIYFDFSGYSDMAIGLGRIFGFRFPENFNYPYIADSVTDFWRRWHMTLSRWFRDYVYIPLGGNRCSVPRQIRNLLVVWFLTGLWHGANWTFVAWGLYYALFLLLEKFVLRNVLPKVPRLIRHGGTLLVVLVGWVFFRSASLSDAVCYLSAMFGFGEGVSAGQAVYYLRQYAFEWVICAAVSMPLVPWLNKKFADSAPAYALGKAFTWGIFLYSYVKLVTGSFNPFIYFHF
ncbi:MAG: MBOAT family protein, partial [Ruminococcaceae bacterium]|nr:MBOAT family protein [Oscillospiraceae bacterium]